LKGGPEVGKSGKEVNFIFHGQKIVINGLTFSKSKIESPKADLPVLPTNSSRAPSNHTLRP